MYSLIYSIYFALKRLEKKRKENTKPPSKLISFMLGYCEWYYNIPFRRWIEKHPSKKYGLNKKQREQKVIVSLTSFPKRINEVWLTIETLFRQTYKADKIILWLAESQFQGIESLPENLRRLQERGLTIRFCDDLRSHKKYFYTMQEYPDDLVILADDDNFFPMDTIKKLMRMHKRYPKEIVCMTTAIITGVDKLPDEWGRPRYNERIEHSSIAQPFTGQGTLYPPHLLDEEYLFRKDLILDLCPYADDLWLVYMALRKGTKTSAAYKVRSLPITIYGTFESGLWHINGKDRKNDIQWQKILNYFKQDDLAKMLDGEK